MNSIERYLQSAAGTAPSAPSATHPVGTPKAPTASKSTTGAVDTFWGERQRPVDSVQTRQQEFWKGTRHANLGGFKSEEEFQASLASARRALHQNQNTEFNGASSGGDVQQLTHKQQAALRLDTQRRQTDAQFRAQQARLRQQNANNTQVQQKTADLSFSGQRMANNYVESTDWAKQQPGNLVRGARKTISQADEWAFSGTSVANAQATETELKQRKYDTKAMAQSPQRARLAIRNREQADKDIASDAVQEKWDRRAFEKSQTDSRDAVLDRRAMERFRLQHPEAYKRWQAREERQVDGLYEGSRPQAQDRADALADEKRREQATLGVRSRALIGRYPQSEIRRRAEENVVASGVRQREYDNESLNAATFGVHDASRRGEALESVANLLTFGGATSARTAGQTGGQAWEEHQQGNQLDAVGNHVDAQKMHAQASENATVAGFEGVMTAWSATGAASLYTGLVKKSVGVAEGRVIASDLKPYPSERLTYSATRPAPSTHPFAGKWVEGPAVNPEGLQVTAWGEVQGRRLYDVNQRARMGMDPSRETLIADHIRARSKPGGKPLPNGTMGEAHAEIGLIQQAYDRGLTRGADMTMKVDGMNVCSHCRRDVPAAAEKAGLRSLRVVQEDGSVLYWKSGTRTFKGEP